MASDDPAGRTSGWRAVAREALEEGWRRPPVAIVVVALLASGCASVARTVPAAPLQGQSAVQQRDDEAWCEDVATTANSEGERQRRYAACMAARGYRVSLPVRVGVDHARVAVQLVEQRTLEQIAIDLRACEGEAARLADASRPQSRDVVTSRIGAVIVRDPLLGPHRLASEPLGTDFSGCLEARGYLAQPER